MIFNINSTRGHTGSLLVYTNIAAMCANICPRNRTDFYPYAINSTPITAYIFLRLHIAISRPLDRSLFAFVLCFLPQKSKRISHSYSSDF